MKRSEKSRARRLSEYVDGMITRSRSKESDPFDGDSAMEDLVQLAAELDEVCPVAPQELKDSVYRRVLLEGNEPGAKATNGEASGWFFPNFLRFKWYRTKLPVPLAVGCVLVLLVAWFWQAPRVSAAAVLARSEMALTNLVGPDEVLHRHWRVTVDSSCIADEKSSVRSGTLDEWLDTTGQIRSAGRSTAADGALRWAYTTGGPQNRHMVYFPPSQANPSGLLSLEPTTEEYYAALQNFPADRQPVLRAYLDRGYLVQPVLGDRQFNRVAITDRTNVENLPREMLRMEQGQRANGEQYYRVSISEPKRPYFWWSSEARPVVWLERQETVSFISADTYLSWRTEEKREDDQGCKKNVVRELIANERLAKSASGSDVFALSVPKGTPVRRQSAVQLLTSVLAALDHGGSPTTAADDE